MDFLRKIIRPHIFFIAILAFTVSLYIVNSMFGMSDYFLFSQELILGYLHVVAFYFVISFSSLLVLQHVQTYTTYTYTIREIKKLNFIAHSLCVVAILSIISYVYNLNSVGGIDYLNSVISGGDKLGGIATFRQDTGSSALNFLMPVALSLYSFLYFRYDVKQNKILIAIIILAVVTRSFMTAARLYLVWSLFPVIINYIFFSRRRYLSLKQVFSLSLALFAFLGMFSLQAYFRSYSGQGNPFGYALIQLIEYFIGGFHLSSALVVEGSPLSFPLETMRYLTTVFSDDWKYSIDYLQFELRWAKPGFNTYGVFGNAFLDYGYFYIAYAIVIGLAFGFVFVCYRSNNLLGILIYPVYLTIFLDCMRISAVSVTQGVIPLFSSCIICFYFFCFIKGK